ncbi:hypothetical protein GL4_0921 [Methyloceanibacter caenitepidi]|uniref:Uncharacterized protein n=1 Tax=Methyloceanibacter caenitepidi TaxID=1384459 RepID=A0A0A8K0W0_9HYPH|nr:hypothetical protein GL4_0921 [Methyloceanibacter caenitepidi]
MPKHEAFLSVGLDSCWKRLVRQKNRQALPATQSVSGDYRGQIRQIK